MPITPAQLAQVHHLLDSRNHSHREIASIVGVHPSTICRIQHRDRPLLPKHGGGRPAKLTERDMRYGKRLITSGKVDTATQLAKELSKTNKESVSAATVRRHLRKAGMRAVAVKKKQAA
ncbi:hypothetical protein BDN72DRAFT_821128 [Pluteus cervinus]|uniref:Uncharacterized protein n=1 Tax=Pluteus cervinus TaxID=181527 RepID=A0ACD3AS89_9AGAR|nr:hypothetical protein BDN72DRAFT_821128 [Pluteus cervinus]